MAEIYGKSHLNAWPVRAKFFFLDLFRGFYQDGTGPILNGYVQQGELGVVENKTISFR